MSFNTSNIQADTLTGVVSISAPTHIVGTVELTQNGDNLNVIGVDAEIVNTDDLIASVSVSTPLLTSPELFPMTVTNLQTVNLTSGEGTEGQVLALDASSNLVWVDNYSSPQGLASVLGVSNDADELGITNLKSLTLTSGAGNEGDILCLDASLNLAWKAETQTLAVVLANGNDANNQSLDNVNNVEAQTLQVMNPLLTKSYTMSFNPLDESLNIATSLGADGSIRITNPDLALISSSFISGSRLLQTQIRTPYDVWVSPDGDDAFPTQYQSSPLTPFKTIQAAINYCEALTAVDNVYRYIHVLAGEYTENLLITKKVYIQGEAQSSLSASVGCGITGVVTVLVNANGSDMFNNQVTLSGLLINGLVKNTSTVNHMLCLENCYIYAPDNSFGQALTHNPSSTDSRLKLWNCQFISSGSSGTSPLVEIGSKGQVNMQYCYLSAKGVQNVLMFSGTANCDNVTNCKLENSNSAGLTAKAVCEITANSSATYSFSNCAFIYSNASDKTANPNASGIRNANTSGNNTIISLYNTFILAGTNTSNNYAIQDFNHTTPTQMICLYYMSGATPSNAFSIHANNNQNKFQLQVVS
jgi:hypothetical protein